MPIEDREITISSETYNRLIKLTTRFEDTPDDVISRLLERYDGVSDRDSDSDSRRSYYRVGQYQPRKKITTEMAMRACELGSKVYMGGLSRGRAIGELENIGMSHGSASIYINIYREMMEGITFKKTAAKPHLRIFMEHIYRTHERARFANAILALEQNIEYREGLGLTCRGEQAILDDMRELLRKGNDSNQPNDEDSSDNDTEE